MKTKFIAVLFLLLNTLLVHASNFSNCVNGDIYSPNVRTSTGYHHNRRWLGYDYKGFVDMGYVFDVSDYGMERFEVTTSHGIQLTPYLYTGVGLGINYYSGEECYSVPLFANVRGSKNVNGFIPFIDFKMGYSVCDVSGLYFCPSVGCGFEVSKGILLNASLGVAVQRDKYDDDYESGADTYTGISLMVGIVF